MYLMEVHHGLFSDFFQLETTPHSGWILITECTANLPKFDRTNCHIVYTREMVARVCPLLLESDDFNDLELRQFVTLMKTLIETAQSGQDWPKVLTKQVHQAGDVKISRASGACVSIPIIQFGKKKTLVRVHAFVSAVGRKVAFISHAFVKPANMQRTPAKEQDRSRDGLRALFDAVDLGTAQFIDTHGGRDGFVKLVGE